MQNTRKTGGAFACYLLLRLFFGPEDRGDMFLRNVGWLSLDYTASYPRRQNSSTNVNFLYADFSVRKLHVYRQLLVTNTYDKTNFVPSELTRQLCVWNLSIKTLLTCITSHGICFRNAMRRQDRARGYKKGMNTEKREKDKQINKLN
jgi:hypothetical protein